MKCEHVKWVPESHVDRVTSFTLLSIPLRDEVVLVNRCSACGELYNEVKPLPKYRPHSVACPLYMPPVMMMPIYIPKCTCEELP